MKGLASRYAPAPAPDLTTSIGSVTLPNPVMTASGTAGYATELSPYFDLSLLGAIVVKSLSVEPWPGLPPPRLHETPAGMLNAVGLQGPGVEAWLGEALPRLLATGARVIASIWGDTIEDFGRAAALLADAPPDVLAVEVNVSCPNHHDGDRLFAHSPQATAEAVSAAAAGGRPVWAKLSPNVADLCAVADAAQAAGAEAVTLVNTLLGMAIDSEPGRPRLGGGGGGLSGPAIRPVAVRHVYECRAALPELPIVGVGGISSAESAAEFLMAGADAVQVGTATFADPRAPTKVLHGLEEWMRRRGAHALRDVIGEAHVEYR